MILGPLIALFLLKFDLLMKLCLEAKTALWGCRTELVLKMAFLKIVWTNANLRSFRRAGVSNLGSESWSLRNMALRLRCRGFLRLFRVFCLDTIFANACWTSSHPPPFCLGVSLCCGLCFRAQGFGRFRLMATQQRNPSLLSVWGWCYCFVFVWLCFFGSHTNLTLFLFSFYFWVGRFFGGSKRHPRKNKTTQPNPLKNNLVFLFLFAFGGVMILQQGRQNHWERKTPSPPPPKKNKQKK